MAERFSAENKELYTKLTKYPNRYWSLISLMTIIGLTFASLLFSNMFFQRSWLELIVPIALAGGLLVIFPITEEWEYTPWQSQTEKREQTFFD